MKSLITLFTVGLAVVAAGTILVTTTHADPLPGRDLLKFSQVPMINTTITNTAGQTNTYRGHDEWSTAYGFSNAANPTITSWDGSFMADDFSDKLSSPVVHVKWWGSYHNDVINPQFPVNKFLIAFESDVPAPVPGFSRPGQVLQADVVNRAAAISGPGSGQFTEKIIRGPDPLLGESLYEYNAELNLNNIFFEQKDTVYWLKVVALVDVNNGQTFPVGSPPPNMTQWGWHNRDYTVQNPLASNVTPPGEQIVGAVDGTNVWHFQDDAVTGTVRYTNVLGTPNFGIFQPVQNMSPTNYLGGGIDGPSSAPGVVGIDQFSKDLAFNLYTTIPEPGTCFLLVCGALSMALAHRRRLG